MASRRYSVTELSLPGQVGELKKYFENLGFKITTESNSIENDMQEIINICDACFRVEEPIAIQNTLNKIVSIIINIPADRSENLIIIFCKKLLQAPYTALAEVCFYPLSHLMNKLSPFVKVRYHVYYCLIKLAKQCNKLSEVFTSVEQLKAQFSLCCEISHENMQNIYRLLYDIVCNTHTKLATQLLIELVGTYTGPLAYSLAARKDAIKCVFCALSNPYIFSMDHLLKLKPISLLKGELVHDLLLIFAAKNLQAYFQFYTEQSDFFEFYELNHLQNIRKLRILKFVELARKHCEMSFDDLAQELQMHDYEVEQFVLGGLQSKLIKGYVDTYNRKVIISSRTHNVEYTNIFLQRDHFYGQECSDLCLNF